MLSSPPRTSHRRSVLPLWRGATDRIHDEEAVFAHELVGKMGVRRGGWKLVKIPEPHGNGDWQLYDLSMDLAERNDLSASHPEKLAEMIALWEAYAEAHSVIMPDWVSGY